MYNFTYVYTPICQFYVSWFEVSTVYRKKINVQVNFAYVDLTFSIQVRKLAYHYVGSKLIYSFIC